MQEINPPRPKTNCEVICNTPAADKNPNCDCISAVSIDSLFYSIIILFLILIFLKKKLWT